MTADESRRAQVFERELWRIAVEHLSWGEQQAWAMLAGARVASNNWRRAKAMLHFDSTGELRRLFLVTCLRRNRNTQLRLRALGEVGNLRDPEAFDDAVEIVGGWSRDERREGVKVLLQALTEKQIGRRDQAARWLWHLAEYSREVHEEYAVQRWPETKRLLGLLVNSAGAAHARNARRLVQAARKQDRRLSAALLAAALAHTPEAQQVLDGARMRMARKPSALARELLQELPQGQAPPRRPPPPQEGRRRSRRRRGRRAGDAGEGRRDAGGDAGRGAGRPRRGAGRPGRARGRALRGRAAPGRLSCRSAQQVHLARVELTRPCAVSTSSAPLSSIPAAVPLPAVPAHLLAAQRVARAPGGEHLGRRARQPALEARQQRAEHLLDARRRLPPAPATWRVRQLRRELARAHVQPDPQHRPALLGPALHEDAGHLAAVDPDVVGPLDRGGQRQRLADRHRGGQRQRLATARAARATSAPR